MNIADLLEIWPRKRALDFWRELEYNDLLYSKPGAKYPVLHLFKKGCWCLQWTERSIEQHTLYTLSMPLMFSGFFHETSMEYPLVFHARKSCGSDGTGNEKVKHNNFTGVMNHCKMTSFYYHNTSGFKFFVQMEAFVPKPRWDDQFYNITGKTKWILVAVATCRHRSNSPMFHRI